MKGPRDDDTVLRIVLADDHPVLREGLKVLLNSQRDMRVVGEASDGKQAWQLTKELRPDVLVIDIAMPVMSGVEAADMVRRDCPDVRVLGLTAHEEGVYLRRLLRAGAAGYVLKRAAGAELVRAVRAVAAGGKYIDPAIAGQLIQGYLAGRNSDDAAATDNLSERERDVLMRIAKGFSNKEIASVLDLSIKTVETYKARMAEKLGLRSRADMVRYAARRGWLD